MTNHLKTIALVPVDLKRSRLGLASHVADRIGGRTVLSHTVQRLARVDQVAAIVLLHPQDQRPEELLGGDCAKPVVNWSDPGGLMDPSVGTRISARKWALSSWRGGLGGATCYDELLPAAPLAASMAEHDADAALIVGGDWPLVDPELCDQLIERHAEAPEAMKMTFTIAPPGLAGVVAGRQLVDDLASLPMGTFGRILSYQPSKPQADPIGRDMCVQIEPSIRNAHHRFFHDTPRSIALLRHMAEQLGERFGDADALEVARMVADLDAAATRSFADLPPHITLELTPRRDAALGGPLVPQNHVSFDRPDMPLELAISIVQQLGQDQDTALTIGGLGDALLHPQWEDVVRAAHEAGVLGIAVETDLTVDEAEAQKLLELPIDVVSVRLNADTAATYEAVMTGTTGGPDTGVFRTVTRNLEELLNESNRRRRDGAAGSASPPWIVPRLLKTPQTMDDLEGFFDRWTHFSQHAVIEPARTGRGRGPGQDLMPSMSPVPMAPPLRTPCRQIERRMTILSDCMLAQCDQDWLGS